MGDKRLAESFAAPFVELAARLDAIAGHEAAARDASARQWDMVAGVGAQLDQLRAGAVDTNHAMSTLASELAEARAEGREQWGVVAGVNLTLGRVADALERAHTLEQKRLAQLSADAPIFHRFAVTGVVQAAPGGGGAVLVLNCGGPSVGREWHVKRLVVGGLTLSTTAAGTAEAYTAGAIPDTSTTGSAPATPTSLSELVDATILASTTLPNIANYDDGQVYLHSREKLWVVIRSGTVGQSYVAAGTAKDMRTAPHEVVG